VKSRTYFGLLTVAVFAGLLVGPASPAWAADPPASFLPDEDGAAFAVGNRLSDRFDGVDTLAHLSLVTSPGANRAVWYWCPQKADGRNGLAGFIDQVELDECTEIGEDVEPKVPSGGATSDEAYELFWNIPAALDLTTRDILALHCEGDLDVTIVEPGGNCAQTLEENVVLDDAPGGGDNQTTSGDIYQICTSSLGLINPCSVGAPLLDGEQTYEGASELFKPFDHGDVVPNDGFVLRVRTSAEENFIDASIHLGADANTNPEFEDASDVCTRIRVDPNYREWECVFNPGQIPDNKTMAIWISETVGGQGECAAATICVLDSHFSASAERRPEPPVAYFVSTPDNGDVENGSSCTGPDVADASGLGTHVRVHGCLQDQFDNPFHPRRVQGVGRPAVTFEQDPASVGSLECIVPEDVIDLEPQDVKEDLDGDGDIDRCSGLLPNPPSPTLADAFTEYPVDLVNDAQSGTQTVTFCIDREPSRADPQHGCADEDDVVTVSETWEPTSGRMFSAFTEPAPADPTDPCRTGVVSKSNNIGDTDTLIACTSDDAGNAVTTNVPGGGQLKWIIDTGSSDKAVEFVDAPPTETSDDGTVTTEIRAIRNGTNFIRVDLVDDNGAVLGSAQVETRVGGGTGGRTPSKVTIRGSFRGRVLSDVIACTVDRKVVLKKKRPGTDKRVSVDRTNSRGKWKIRIFRPNGRYYAKLKKNPRCTGDKSRTVRR
jgi:hypothetical protein